ncbi:MAG: hypothetical protein RBQ99_07030 [Trichlorobacter sp.]|jgi:hypothetical protein|nr:hypothetical protein [Trichlorobacter sp.]
MNKQEAEKPMVKRLCSEIQLFDLCELTRCSFKVNNFCTDPALLEKFEAIEDVDEDEDSGSSGRTSPLNPGDLEEWDDDTDYGLNEDTEEDDYSVFDYEGDEEDF